jgi:hypothetical protein
MWGKKGLLLNNGKHELRMLAPPVDYEGDYDMMLKKQGTAAKRMGVDGLVSHNAAAAAILNNPTPVISIIVEPENEPPVPIDRLKAKGKTVSQ